jgi:lipopolysaccharide export LptBFGC system permease protein LptF
MSTINWYHEKTTPLSIFVMMVAALPFCVGLNIKKIQNFVGYIIMGWFSKDKP